MDNFSPDVMNAITRDLDYGAMLRDILTLNEETANIIKWAFGDRSANVPKSITADQINLLVVADELGRSEIVNIICSCWKGSKQEQEQIKIAFAWHIFNEMKRSKIETLTGLN